MKDKKPILCIDFDGVIHAYTSGWQGPRNIPDDIIPGAIEFLDKATGHFKVCIYSSRSRYLGAKRAMKKWIRAHYENYVLEQYPEFIERDPMNEDRAMYESVTDSFMWSLKFPTRKPPAFLMIDDRAFLFKGEFPNPKKLLKFKPWYKND